MPKEELETLLQFNLNQVQVLNEADADEDTNLYLEDDINRSSHATDKSIYVLKDSNKNDPTITSKWLASIRIGEDADYPELSFIYGTVREIVEKYEAVPGFHLNFDMKSSRDFIIFAIKEGEEKIYNAMLAEIEKALADLEVSSCPQESDDLQFRSLGKYVYLHHNDAPKGRYKADDLEDPFTSARLWAANKQREELRFYNSKGLILGSFVGGIVPLTVLTLTILEYTGVLALGLLVSPLVLGLTLGGVLLAGALLAAFGLHLDFGELESAKIADKKEKERLMVSEDVDALSVESDNDVDSAFVFGDEVYVPAAVLNARKHRYDGNNSDAGVKSDAGVDSADDSLTVSRSSSSASLSSLG